MNHATWSVGTLSAPSWRQGGHHQAPRPLRPGSTSPRRDRKHPTKTKHENHSNNGSRSNEGSPRQRSPVMDVYDKRHSYHYLGASGCRSGSFTPPASRNGRKKKSHKSGELSVEGSNISKSPSAPNLNATSMLALQGSLTAFITMAPRKSRGGNSKISSKPEASATKGSCSVVITSSREEEPFHSPEIGETIARKKADMQFEGRPHCSCSRRNMSPIPRLDMHAHVPQNQTQSLSPDTLAWQERRPGTNELAKRSIIQNNPHLKNSVFKETSV